MNKINNKGFTLIELLAVMVILISVSLVAVGGISASLENRAEKECDEQKELAISAAKIYFSLNNSVNPSSGVSIGTLKSVDYFSNNSKLNRLNDGDIVKLNSNNYVYVGECN